jgi:hypothetical protein
MKHHSIKFNSLNFSQDDTLNHFEERALKN